jgi:hypothetical protein
MAKKSGGLSKVEMVREAIAKLGWDASTREMQKYILDTFKIEMSIGHISQTKSTERRKQGIKSTRRRKRRGGVKETAVAGSPKVTDILNFLDAIRDWEAKLGAATVREVVQKALKK